MRRPQFLQRDPPVPVAVDDAHVAAPGLLVLRHGDPPVSVGIPLVHRGASQREMEIDREAGLDGTSLGDPRVQLLDDQHAVAIGVQFPVIDGRGDACFMLIDEAVAVEILLRGDLLRAGRGGDRIGLPEQQDEGGGGKGMA